MSKEKEGRVAIVGSTGIVGQEFVKIFSEDKELKDFEILKFAQTARPDEGVFALSESAELLQDCQYILNSTGNDVAQSLAAKLKKGQILIDNSSHFRMDPETPLIVPEINGELVGQPEARIFANPNCTAILLCMTLSALKEFGVQRVVVSTYQAASGAGIKGLEELSRQQKELAANKKPVAGEVFRYPLAGNVMSHNSDIREESEIGALYNDEEWKVIEETRKILDYRHLPISVTSMRVPVERAHTESVSVDLKQDVPLSEIREAFAKRPGLKIVDEPSKNYFPMPLEAEHQDEVYVGRIRKDVTLGKTIHYILSGDQLRKGAALNAVQILKTHLALLRNKSN